MAAIFIASTAFGQGAPSTQAGGAITINDNANGSPYPSTVLVTNYAGAITRITVTVSGVTHGYPDDVDLVLEGPAPLNRRVILWSDAGGQFDLNSVDLTFDSSSPAAPLLPDEAQIASGRYRPTNNNPGGDTDPAIASGGGTDLSVFNGDDANGEWRLYVNDDHLVDAGNVRSWTLTVFTEPILSVTNEVTTAEDTAANIAVSVNDSDTPASGLTFSTIIPESSEDLIESATFAGTGTNRTLTIQPHANQTGSGTVEVRVADGVVTRSEIVDVTVTPVNDRPTVALNTATTQVPQGGISTNIVVTVADIDDDPATLTLSAISSNPSVVPASNIYFVGSGTNNAVWHARFTPAANASPGTATITVVVSDDEDATNTTTIAVTILPVSHVVAGNPAAITIPNDGTATPYPSTVNVVNVSGLIGKLTVTLHDFNHAEPDDAGALLVGPGGQAVVLMRGAGGAAALNDQRLVFDEAAGDIPAGALTTSTNGTADNGSGDFPSPAPLSTTFSADLTAFNGTNPNGTWSLYVYDTEANTAGGAINGGFSLTILPAPTVGVIGGRTTPEDTPLDVSFTVSDQDGPVTNIIAQITDQYPPRVNLTTELSGNTGTVHITPIANLSGINIIRVIAQDTNGFTGTNLFSLVITPVNDLPTQEVIPKQLARAGQSVGPIEFDITDVETPAANLGVSVSSNNPKLLPPGAIVLGGSGTTRTITIFPSGAQGGQADVTVTVVDADNGSVSQTFDLTVEEAAFPLLENLTPIQINDSGTAAPATATPYPSVISVSGLSSPISEVTVTLFGITHPNPDDLDIMLVHPNGALANVVFMSDAGNSGPLNNITLIFRDSAASSLPDGGTILSGTYRPSNYEADDFPIGGSPDDGPQATFDAAFDGLTANGDWRLYVVDDTGDIRGGVITSWQLGIRTRPVIADIADQITTEDTQLRFSVDLGDRQPGVALTIDETIAPTGGTTVNIVDSITYERSGDSVAITIVPVENAFGTNLITLTVTDPDGFVDTEDFNFIVTSRNDAPQFSDIDNTSTPAATPITLAFTVVDVEGSSVAVTAASSNPTVVANSGITVSPASGTTQNRTVTIVPEGIGSGDTTITLTGNDGAGGVSTETFTLSVTRNVSFANTRPITINDFAPGTPYPSTIDVSGVLGTVSAVRVTVLGLTHQFPDDIDVLLVAPDNREVMLMSDAGGGQSQAVSNLRLSFAAGAPLIPDSGQLTSGVFGPQNWTDLSEGDETALPSPAPAGPYGDDLSSLNGLNPNGQWRLFVRDDTFGLSGEITSGWILILETGPTISAIGAQTTQEDIPAVIPFTVSDQDTAGTDLITEVSFSGNSVTDLVVGTNLVITGESNDRVLTVTPSSNLSGTNLITLTVEDENGTQATTSFAFTVTAVDDSPTIDFSTNVFTMNEDDSITIPFTIGDLDSTVGQTNVTVTSSNGALVPNSEDNIALGGEVNDAGDDEANLTLTIDPAANQSGSTTLTIAVADASSTSRMDITLVVTPVNDTPFIASITNRIVVQAGATSGIVNVQITDVETSARNLVLSANSLSPTIIPNSNIILGGSDTNRTVQVVALATTGTATATINLLVSDGTVTNTLPITVEVIPAAGSVFSNLGVITIRDNNSATPYPSTIVVSGMRGPISRVSATLDGFSHTAPDDVDVLLVHRPTGRRVMLISDSGGANAVSNIRLNFDARQGNRNLADDSPLTSGVFLPSDYETGDTLPTGAPAGPYSTDLTAFNGASGNGEWDLYVVDDAANNSGQIAFGWSLRIETAPTVVVNDNEITTNEDTAQNVTLTLDDMTTINGLGLSFANSNPTLIAEINQSPNPISGPTVNLEVVPAPNQSGTNILTITVTRPDSDPNLPDASTSTIVTNVFLPINDPPTLSRLVDQTTQEDIPVSFDILVGDADHSLSELWLQADVAPAGELVISDTNVVFNGTTNLLKGLPANVVRVTLNPNTSAVGSALVTITLSEADGLNPVSGNFTLTVTERNDLPIIVNTNGALAIAAGETETINIKASDPEGLTTVVTASSSDQTLVLDANIVVDPASESDPDRTVTITAQPGVQGRTTVTLVAADPSNRRTTNIFTVDVRPTRERVFSNRNEIVINDNGAASAYPSTINVTGLAGTVAKVTVTINRFYHTFPDDVDMLLVSPAGQKVIIWSDMGGADPDPTNLVVKLDDGALNSLPNNGPLVNGTFKPTADDSSSDPFPTPAPAVPYADTLAAFNGQSPNGAWSLFIIDDTASDSGRIVEGWSLGITTQPVLVGLVDVVSQEDVSARVSFTVAEESFAGTDFTFTAASSNPTVVPSTGNIFFAGAGTNQTVTVVPATNAVGDSTITVTLRNSDGQEVTDSFVASFTAVNDRPLITQVPNQTLTIGSQVTVTNFNYSDVETEKKDIVVEVASSNPTVIAPEDVVIIGNDLTLISRGVAVGRSIVTITVTDAGDSSQSMSFEVAVTGAANPVFVNTEDITIRDFTTALPYPSTITVSNVAGTISKVTVTLTELRHAYPDDVDILLVGPSGESVVLMSDAGAGGPNTPAALENARLTFDDAGAALPDNSEIPEFGTFRPSNYEGSDAFPAPAPAGPYGATLSVFTDTLANGTWSLYVMDDASPDPGSIGSWLLSIQTTAPSVSEIPDVMLQEDVPVVIPFTINAANVDPTNLVVSAVIVEGTPILTLSLGGTGTERTLALTPRSSQVGTNVITVSVTDGTNIASTTFTAIVENVDNDAPVIGTIGTQTIDVNETLVLTLPVTDSDTAVNNLTFFASNAGTNIVADIRFNITSSNTVTMTVTPRVNAFGTETITVSASDGENITRSTFVLNIRSDNDVPVIEPIANVQTAEDVNVTVRVNVSDAETPLGQLVITGTSSNTNLVTSIEIENTGTQVDAAINLGANQFGTADITIRASDGTNFTTRTFSLLVINVPDAPIVGVIPDQAVAPGSTTATVPISVTDEDTPLTSMAFLSSVVGTNVVQSITFDVTSNSVAAVIALRPNGEGTDAITVTVTDGDTVVRRTFNLTVGEVPVEEAVLGVSRTGTNLTINITGTAGASYVVEGTANFTSWTLIRIIEIGENGSAVVVVPITGSHRFFRATAVGAGDTLGDVTQPGDVIFLVNGTNDGDTASGAPPAAEGVARSIDNAGQKYLNFLDLGSGFTVTPSVGGTIVTGLTLWPANDAPERDPASYKLEGANDFDGQDGTFTVISEGPITLATNRNAGGVTTALTGTNFTTVTFPNTASYTSYRVTFPTLRDAATANSMQIAEVDLVGKLQ